MTRVILAVAAAALALPAPAGATWSGRNGRIAFIHTWAGVGHRPRDLRLWVMNVDGSHKRDLTGGASSPAFSPNGRTIAYTCMREADEEAVYAHICVIDSSGRNKRQLTNARAGRDGQPVFSQDGRTIEFTRRLDRDLPYAIDLAGGRARRISASAAAAFRPGLPWYSSDGATIVANETHGIGGGALFTAWPDRTHRRYVPGSPDDAGMPAFAPDGGQILFVRIFLPPDGPPDYGHVDIYAMHLDGTGLRALARSRSGWSATQPVWGPTPQ